MLEELGTSKKLKEEIREIYRESKKRGQGGRTEIGRILDIQGGEAGLPIKPNTI